jgi:ABC-type protease/lipase transport system fused ATPase/permease subunit
MDSKVGLLVLAVFTAVVLWLLGGFVFGHALGMICVFASIVVVGLAAGNLMNTPEPSQENR